MKRIFMAAICLALVSGMTSCSKVMMKSAPVYSLHPVIGNNLEPDLEVKQRLTGEISGKFGMWGGAVKIKGFDKNNFVFGNDFYISRNGMERAKAAAMAKALQDSNCDMMINPMYQMTQKGRKFTLKVSGYGAVLKGIK